MKYFHNPRCRKSREGLSILEEKGLKPNIIYYLKEPLSKEDIIEVVNLLNISALDLIRKNEPIFKEKFKGKKLSENELKEYLSKISDEALYAYNVYQIEGEGRNLFLSINGDEDTIMGLPIKKIKEYLSIYEN